MPPKPFYESGLRFECTGCGNCCRIHGEYAYVYLLEKDVRAMARHLGIPAQEFFDRYCQLEDDWIIVRMDDPACPFLTEDNRCSVYPVRPKQCATWPFWEENLVEATWNGSVKECCPGIGKGPLYPKEEVERIARETEDYYEEVEEES